MDREVRIGACPYCNGGPMTADHKCFQMETMTRNKAKPLTLTPYEVKLALEGKPFLLIRRMEPQPLAVHGGGIMATYRGSRVDSNLDSPFGKLGEEFWVREDYWIDRREPNLIITERGNQVITKNPNDKDNGRTDVSLPHGNHYWDKKEASTMPQWASRLTIIHKGTTVKRVQDISAEDTKKEGIGYRPDKVLNPFVQFEELWNAINEKRGFGWDVNPWVWVVEFKEIK